MPSPEALAYFVACVVVASFLQSLTAFAFGLVLLSLVELFRIVPISDAADASMVLALVNSLTFLVQDRKPLLWAEVKHVLWASGVGVAAGLVVQQWLSANAADWLRLLLGVAVLLSAVNLMSMRRVKSAISPPHTFAFYGALSGLMGGLFATSGPPIVYHLLRQPYDPLYARRCLVLIFAMNNTLRLSLVAGTGHFSQQSLLLCAVSLPVAICVSALCVRYPLSISRTSLLRVTGLLLTIAGISLAASAAMQILGSRT